MIAQENRPQFPNPGRHWCVVLAAGGSRRLGRPKQLVTVAGVPLVRRACLLALQTAPAGVIVVAGAHGARVAAALRGLPVVIVRNREWRGGLATSLRAGLRRVRPYAPSALVLTVDQWRVSAADLQRLLRAGAPAAASYAGIRGVPALLPRAWRAPAGALRGDRGARALLARPDVRPVVMPSAVHDLDTRADLAKVRGGRGSRLSTRPG